MNEKDMEQAQAAVMDQPAETETETKIENKKKKPVKEILLAAVLALAVFSVGMYGIQIVGGSVGWLPFGRSSPEKIAAQNLKNEVSRLTSPEYITAGDGTGTYYLLDSDFMLSQKYEKNATAYGTFLTAMRDYLSDEAYTEELRRDEYEIEIPGKTITVDFSCTIPFSDFLDYHRMKMPFGSRIYNVSRITLSPNNGGFLYIYDGKKDRYYRINDEGKESTVMTPDFIEGLLISASQNAEKAMYTCEPIWYGEEELLPENLAGAEAQEELKSKNFTVPTSTLWTVPPTDQYIPEYSPQKKTKMKRLEKIFFPEGIDFVHKVNASNGNVIYMYGSNEKMLRVYNDGGFLYTQEIGTKGVFGWLNIGHSPDFYDSLEKAVSYIKEHGGWPSEDNENTEIRLVKVKKLQKDGSVVKSRKIKGYRYIFEVDLLGFPLKYQKGKQLSVDIYGDQVAAYHRDLPDLTKIKESERQSRGTTDPHESVYARKNTVSGIYAGGISRKNSSVKESASYTEGGTAVSLKSVIKINNEVLSEALEIEESDEETEGMNRIETIEEIMNQMTSAELQLLRMDTEQDLSESDDPGEKAEKNGKEEESSEEEENTDQEAEEENGIQPKERILDPAWKISVGNRTYWFQARTGGLLYSN